MRSLRSRTAKHMVDKNSKDYAKKLRNPFHPMLICEFHPELPARLTTLSTWLGIKWRRARVHDAARKLLVMRRSTRNMRQEHRRDIGRNGKSVPRQIV